MFGGPKSFAQHVLGIFAQFDETCFSLAESTESSPVDEEEVKMDNGVDTSLASEEIDLSVDLLEARPCPWDPEWCSSKWNYPVRDD